MITCNRAEIQLEDFVIKGCPIHEPITDVTKNGTADKVVFGGLVRYPIERVSGTTTLKFGLYGYCNLGDTYGYKLKGDTIILEVGTPISYKEDSSGKVDSSEYEIEVAFCKCYHQYSFYFSGLSDDKSYYLGFINKYPGFSIPTVFSTTDPERLSIFFKQGEDVEYQIDGYVEEDILIFREISDITSKFTKDKEIDKDELEDYKNLVRKAKRIAMALKDPYLTDKIDSTELSEKIDGLRRLTKDNRGVIFSNMIILKEQRKRIEWWLK